MAAADHRCLWAVIAMFEDEDNPKLLHPHLQQLHSSIRVIDSTVDQFNLAFFQLT